MKRWIPFLLSALLAAPAAAVVIDGIAAVVNGRVITRTQVREAADLLERTGEARGAEARRKALDELIDNALVEREAERLGIRVTEDDLERALSEICRRNSLDRERLPEILEAQGVEFDRYLDQVRSQIRRMKLASRVLSSRLEVSDEALREYYLKHVASFREPDSVHLLHILAPTREVAEAARRRVLAGENFQEVAREVSTGPGAKEGGDMGFLPLKSLAGPVRDAVAGVPAGGLSDVVEIRGTYHLFYVVERRKGRIPAFEEVRDWIRERYFRDREAELYRTWIESLRKKARIEIKM